jgi:predicted kinase
MTCSVATPMKEKTTMKQENQRHESPRAEVEKPRSLSDHKPALIVVTGIMAAGKSTIARLLAQRFVRGVHIEADALQRMIVSGGEWVSQPGESEGEAAEQLGLRLKNLCLLGRSFFEAGFTVVLDDIIMGERWLHLQEELHDLPFSLVVLAPPVEVVASQRDRNRAKAPQGHAWATYLDHALRSTMAGVGLWMDTSEQTPEETVEQILQHLQSEQ